MIALIAGATGLVGSAIARELAARLGSRATALVRQPAPALPASIDQVVCDFSRLDGVAPIAGASVAFCALGTTIAKAGSKTAFRSVDHDAIVAFAQFGRRSGAQHFLLVSSVGASERSANFYLRVKGETERDVRALGYQAVEIFRPSFLLGQRAETRQGESWGIAVARLLNPLLAGPLEPYRAIEAATVAKAMVTAGCDLPLNPGVRIHHFGEITALAARPPVLHPV